MTLSCSSKRIKLNMVRSILFIAAGFLFTFINVLFGAQTEVVLPCNLLEEPAFTVKNPGLIEDTIPTFKGKQLHIEVQLTKQVLVKKWKKILSSLKQAYPRKYNEGIEYYAAESCREIRLLFASKTKTKDAFECKRLLSKLQEKFTESESGIPVEFWEQIPCIDSDQDVPEKYKETFEFYMRDWYKFWWKFVKQYENSPRLMNEFNNIILWDHGDIDMMREKGITDLTRFVNTILSLPSFKYQKTYTATTMREGVDLIIKNGSLRDLKLSHSVLECIFIVPIPNDRYMTYSRYTLEVTKNVQELDQLLLGLPFHFNNRLFTSWLNNVEKDAKHFDGEKLSRDVIYTVVTTELDLLYDHIKASLQKVTVDFCEMVSLLNLALKYVHGKNLHIPSEVVTYISFIEHLKKPISGKEYIVQLTTRVDVCKEYWKSYENLRLQEITRLKSLSIHSDHLSLGSYEPKNRFDIRKDFIILDEHPEIETTGDVFTIKQITFRKIPQILTARLYLKDEFFYYKKEIYIYHYIWGLLRKSENTHMRKHFLEAYGTVFDSFSKHSRIFKTYYHGLVFDSAHYSLDVFYKNFGPLKFELVQAISCQIFQILCFFEAHGIIHFDLKPSNLLIKLSPGFEKTLPSKLALKESKSYFNLYMENVTVMITGFSSTKIKDALYKEMQWPINNAYLFQTDLYRAPETQLKAVSYTPAVDVFSGGLIVIELLLGHPYLEFTPYSNSGDASFYCLLPSLRLILPEDIERTKGFPSMEKFGSTNLTNYSKNQKGYKRFWTRAPRKYGSPVLENYFDGDILSKVFKHREYRNRQQQITEFLYNCLRLDPSKRFKPSQLVALPFLCYS